MLRPSTLRGMPALGCADERQGSDAAQALDGVQHGGRTDGAVAADHVDAQVRQPRAEGFRVGAVEAVAVFVDGDVATMGRSGAASRAASTAWCSSSM